LLNSDAGGQRFNYKKYIMVRQKYFAGERQKYTKYNKVNNNSENFRRVEAKLLLPSGPP